MNLGDLNWLEILKVSGWRSAALTVALVSFIVLVQFDVVPTTDSPLWIALPTIGALIFGCLALTSIGVDLFKAIKPIIDLWRRRRLDRKQTRDYIPHMNEDEKAIIGYLLYHNEKTFQCEKSGGYAAPLISRGIIHCSLIPGQSFDANWVPFHILGHVWDVLKKYRSSFPYEREHGNRPWTIHWMVR